MSSLHVLVIHCSRQLTVSILADAQSKLCNSNNIQFVIIKSATYTRVHHVKPRAFFWVFCFLHLHHFIRGHNDNFVYIHWNDENKIERDTKTKCETSTQDIERKNKEIEKEEKWYALNDSRVGSLELFKWFTN